jgi:Leucine-rich repeat (LRR) protein
MTQKTGHANPVFAATGTLVPTHFSKVPDEIVCELIWFIPDSVRVLRAVSRVFKQNTEEFLQQNTEEILSWCSFMHSPLANLIGREFVSISARSEAQPDRTSIQFNISLPRVIRSLGVSMEECPGRILLSHEIPPFNSRIENMNLEKAWGPLQRNILDANPQLADVPAEDATAGEIRAWMYAEPNQPLLQGITRLDLSGYELTCLPEEIGLCTGLQRLYLDHNQLTTLPERVFREMNALQRLYLFNNRLVYLPEGIFRGLNALQQLDLNNNQLTALPEGIFRGMNALQRLYLENNQLTSLPEEIFRGLNALQRLCISYNRLTTLPEGIFQRLNALQQLYFRHNQLITLPEGIFQGMIALQQLAFGNNRVTTLSGEIFQGLNALQELYLDNNQLTTLSMRTFQELIALQELHLDYNQLTTLPGEIFQGLNALRLLYLEHSQLTTLPEEIFRGLNNLEELYLYDNPQLLVSYNDIPIANNREFSRVMDEFFNYTCISPLAVLYQLAAKNAPLGVVQASFSRLPMTIKTALYEKVREEAGRPIGDPEWSEHRVFEDMLCFQRVLKRYVRESFEALRPDQKTVVYGHVSHLAENLGVPVDPNVPNWGEEHAFDNVPRLIDAMMLSKQGTARLPQKSCTVKSMD